MNNYLYITLVFLSVAFPILWSFEKKMFFFSKWNVAIKSILIAALPFLIWDVIFTQIGVWGFNSKYNIGVSFLGLPLEEILFFLLIPFSCMFIYETVYFLLRDRIWKGMFYQLSLVVCITLFFVGTANYDKWYTVVASIGASALLFYHCARKKQISHEVFWVSYFIVLVPFTLVNGILTGYFTEEPVVWYNNTENLGIRFLTIPVEDFAYNLLLMLLAVTFYERFLGRLYKKDS